MKIKNKGKVHPSPSPSSSSFSPSSSFSSSSSHGDYFSILKLLPAAILTLISVLSLEDREVLAYMITRSLKTTTITTAEARSSSSFVVQDSKIKNKRISKKQVPSSSHKPPVFDCDCFDCYTSYWFRWDSSPNRELIHQAIEAFEDHLTNGEAKKSKRNGKKREKSARRVMDRPDPLVSEGPSHFHEVEEESLPVYVVPDGDLTVDDTSPSPGISLEEVAGGGEDEVAASLAENAVDSPVETPPVVRKEAVCGHKGLARKVLPDVLGLFNSRLWSLWNPNV